VHLFWPWELIKGHQCQSSAGEGERKTERFLRKLLGFCRSFLFFWFLHNFHFAKFCRTRYFEFFNSVLAKNLEMDSSFFRFFYF
jgi:hypothetical protein